MSVDGREGRRIAQLFRRYRLPADVRDARRCDLDTILGEDGLEVCESEFDEGGYTACLIRVEGGGGGIFLSRGQDMGRRRFSLAHELGHYHIPSHEAVGIKLGSLKSASVFSCADADLRIRSTDAHKYEWEANDFATELLMPQRLFAADVGHREITFRTVSELAGPAMYDVSLTAAAWRLVETTRESCALVVSTDGEIDWTVRSRAFNYPLAERRRPLPVGSVAHAIFQGEAANESSESVDPAVWLASSDGRWVAPSELELTESTRAIPRLRQTLSLLWAIEPDA